MQTLKNFFWANFVKLSFIEKVFFFLLVMNALNGVTTFFRYTFHYRYFVPAFYKEILISHNPQLMKEMYPEEARYQIFIQANANAATATMKSSTTAK